MRPEASALLPQWARYSPVPQATRLSQPLRVRVPTLSASIGVNTRCPVGATATPPKVASLLTVEDTSTQLNFLLDASYSPTQRAR
eukprot:4406440-Prymnesium_polylepis.1